MLRTFGAIASWFRHRFRRTKSAQSTGTLPPVPEGPVAKVYAVSGDNPIRVPSEDSIGRATSARSFASSLLRLDTRQGVVAAVLGEWGSGKTSFVNMAVSHLRDDGIPVVDFNPWMFSGSEHLVDAFFSEVCAQLRVHTAWSTLSKALGEYGDAVAIAGPIPVVGDVLEGARKTAQVTVRYLRRHEEGIENRRRRVVTELSRLTTPLVVVLDDIDRLTTVEIRAIFRLVRLTASFPNVIYVLAFDRLRVEQALSEDGIPGRRYLEKIVQYAVDLPATPPLVLQSQLFQAMSDAIDDIEGLPALDPQTWADIFQEIIRPLVKNMRDVRRYANAIQGTVREIGTQVALADVLAMEAIRVFLPDVFYRIQESIEALTIPSGMAFASSRDPELRVQVEAVLAAAGDQRKAVRSLITRVFPAAERHVGGSGHGTDWLRRWIKDRRVAHHDILRLYLERIAGDSLRAVDAARLAWSKFNDGQALLEYLLSIERTQLHDVIGGLEAYEDDFRPEHAIQASFALLQVLPHIPEQPPSIFRIKSKFAPLRVVHRLLRAIGDAGQTEAAVREILRRVSSLSVQSELILLVGHRDRVGTKLVTEGVALAMESEWRERMRNASIEALCEEKELLTLVYRVGKYKDPSEPDMVVSRDVALTRHLLMSARTEVIGQKSDSRAVSSSPRLHWKLLLAVLGDEVEIRNRLADLDSDADADVREAVSLAHRYLDGWRPDED